MNSREKTLILTEGAIMIALAALLNLIKFQGPWAAGGSISLKMLPLVVFALRHGFKWGIFAGFIYGVVDFIMEPFIVGIVPFLLDYGLAFLVIGFAGLIKVNNGDKRNMMFWKIGIATFIAMALNFLMHYLSGVAFYGAEAPPGQPVALYSLLYNGSYVGPSFILVLIVVLILATTVPKIMVRR